MPRKKKEAPPLASESKQVTSIQLDDPQLVMSQEEFEQLLEVTEEAKDKNLTRDAVFRLLATTLKVGAQEAKKSFFL